MADKLLCSKCKSKKPINGFDLDINNVNRRLRASWCKECKKVKTKLWRDVAHVHRRNYAKRYRKLNPGLTAKYTLGISFEDKKLKFEEQGKVCGGCGGKNHKTRRNGKLLKGLSAWCVDHDHKTGKFRGVLCQDCNSALGRVKDSIKTLERLVAYLKGNK